MPTSRRLAVRVTRDAERQIRGGHPWVFDESIVSVKPEGDPGDLAVVFDAKRAFVAIGLYDPASPIRIKVLHRGAPETIDAAWFRSRVQAALDVRAPLASSPDTNAYRCIHGENDGLPGLVLDRYDDTYVLKVYSAAWWPHLDDVVRAIDDLCHPSALVLRLARAVAPHEGRTDGSALLGTLPGEPVLFVEHDLTFEADVVHGQKTGFFLDQRDNRARVRDLSGGKGVLDVFSCTGGFSVHAAAGGARLVHSVDIAPGVIAAAERNMACNLPVVAGCEHRTSVGDALEVLHRLADRDERYDLVVVDPPSFASRQTQVENGLRAYARLTEAALRLLEPGGILVQASCSSRIPAERFYDGILDAARGVGVRLVEIERTGHPLDHPVGFPQGAYLKALFARKE